MKKTANKTRVRQDLLEKTFYIDANFKTKQLEEDEQYIYIEGYASTPTKDRHNDEIPLKSWNRKALKAYKKNPIVLFQHDHKDPVGRATSVKKDEKGLKIEAKIDKDTVAAEKIKKGFVCSFSVGIIIKDLKYNSEEMVWIITELELVEISVCTIPANGEALFDIKKQLGENYEAFKNTFIPQNQKQFSVMSKKIEDALESLKKSIKDFVGVKKKESPEGSEVRILDEQEVQEKLKAFEDAMKEKSEKVEGLEKDVEKLTEGKEAAEEKAKKLQKELDKLKGIETPVTDPEKEEEVPSGGQKKLTQEEKANAANAAAFKDW